MPTPRQQIDNLQEQLNKTRSELAITQQQWRTTAEERDRYAAQLIDVTKKLKDTSDQLIATQKALDEERSKPIPDPPVWDAGPLISCRAECERLEMKRWTARGALWLMVAGDRPLDSVPESEIELVEQKWLNIMGVSGTKVFI